ncbi:hypothetical protein FIBSPDRAFT_958571 [Athelia psychrophila]|uniref:Uncharacterized protein n=1 Tax=Athelia psychrophila TaxID=1759441 RepID=A0A166EG63_9AGAM|nr:hypothetical protein FIBSPDRAFT_958571 [Fibularhizoctonia sp. CBS 109695]
MDSPSASEVPDSESQNSPSPVPLPQFPDHSNKRKRPRSAKELKPNRPQPPTLESFQPGRPSHVTRSVKRQTAITTPDNSPPAPRKKKSARVDVEYTPLRGMIVQHALQTALPTYTNSYSRLDDDTDTSVEDSDPPARARPHTKLNNISHQQSKGWTKVGVCHTMELHRKFDELKLMSLLQHNDFTPHKYETAEGFVERQSFGHPVNRPQDLRARPFIVKWTTPDGHPPSKYKTGSRPVMRVYYNCTGNCNYTDSTSSSDDTESDEAEETGSSDKEDKPQAGIFSTAKKVGRGGKCKGNVQLHVEVMSNDLSEAIIWQRHSHTAVPDVYLAPSNHIRQTISEYASLHGMTAGRIKRRLTLLFEDKAIPRHRRHTAKQVDSIVSNVRRRDRLIRDPLLAIEEFAERNPEKIFRFDPPDMSTDPPSGFATGIKHPYAVQSLLLWARKEGLGLDSTWRHMNENRAPVTFVTTVDDNGRMVPGPVYISSDVTADTMALFLQDIKLLVEAEAEKIVNGGSEVAIDPGLLEHRESLLAESRIVIQEGWWPAFFMIDKSRAEKNGIQRVFPGIPIRICQFHVVQAILRWEKDEPSGQGRPKLSLVQKHHLLYAVRDLQRCRDSHDWDDKLRVFYRRVGVLSNDDIDKAERIKAYFNVNWFKLEWRGA